MTDLQPTVRDLLAVDALAGAAFVGGRAGLDRRATDVLVLRRLTHPVAAGSVVILEHRSDSSELDADLALRNLAEGNGALLILDATIASRSTARIADMFEVCALAVHARTPWMLANALGRLIHAPLLTEAELVIRSARTVAHAGADPELAVARLGGVLKAPVSIIDSDGTAIAGGHEAEIQPELLATAPRTLPAVTRGGLMISVPVVLESAPAAWLVCGPVDAGPTTAAATVAALEVAGAGLAGVFAKRQVLAERDARMQVALIKDLQQMDDDPPPQLAERLLTAGWRTAGWHAGVELRLPQAASRIPAPIAHRVEQLIAEHAGSSTGTVIVRVEDGWCGWVTSASEPASEWQRALVRDVREAVDAAAPTLALCGGVGSPHAGLRGIRRTLAEAHEAWLLARATGSSPKVTAVGEQDARKLLLAPGNQLALRPHAESLLAPLLDAEPELLTTLEHYLTAESSTASTAASLAIHRNTVTARIRRAEQLLGVDLADADDRLAIQLACRLLRS
jgi:hypothetical protein